MEILVYLEFWLNRYQTLLAGVLAIAAAIIANNLQKRSAYVDYYRVISSAIELIDEFRWSRDVGNEATLSQITALFYERQQQLKTLRREIAAIPLKVEEVDIINASFSEIESELNVSGEFQGSFRRDQLRAHDPASEKTEMWFHLIQMADGALTKFKINARKALDARRSNLVEKLS